MDQHQHVFGHDVQFDVDGKPIEKGIGSLHQPKPNVFVKPEPEVVRDREIAAAHAEHETATTVKQSELEHADTVLKAKLAQIESKFVAAKSAQEPVAPSGPPTAEEEAAFEAEVNRERKEHEDQNAEVIQKREAEVAAEEARKAEALAAEKAAGGGIWRDGQMRDKDGNVIVDAQGWPIPDPNDL